MAKQKEIVVEEKPEIEKEIVPDAPPEKPDVEGLEPQKRKRGRPKGSTNKPADKPSKSSSRKRADNVDFARQLQGIHTMMAMVTGFPELQISEQESVMLANGLVAVADEYGLSLDGKTGAAIQLIGAASLIYIPRAIVIKGKLDKARPTDVEVTYPETGNGNGNAATAN